jgi:hypothetical protein
MSAIAKILTSIHGKRLGLSALRKLVVEGRTAVVQDDTGAVITIQGAPATIDATGTLTAADLKKKIVTSTSAAVVTATLPTGTLLDASFAGLDAMQADECFRWVLINTGPSAVTIAAGTDHTIVGAAVIAATSAREFITRKTAANTFVTYLH